MIVDTHDWPGNKPKLIRRLTVIFDPSRLLPHVNAVLASVADFIPLKVSMNGTVRWGEKN